MYLGPPAREGAGKIAPQPAQGVVPQPRRGHHEGGRRGHLPSEAAAAPYLLVLLASGVSPVYSCHVSPAQMRQHPIGTGPFKFVEYKPNESVRLTRNTDYWKPGRPYLDGLEFPIVASVATRNLMFIADNVDMTLSYGVSMPLLRDIKSQVTEAICTTTTDNGARNLIINPVKPPFDNAELRRAVSLALDRKAFVDILVEGQGLIDGVMQPRRKPLKLAS